MSNTAILPRRPTHIKPLDVRGPVSLMSNPTGRLPNRPCRCGGRGTGGPNRMPARAAAGRIVDTT